HWLRKPHQGVPDFGRYLSLPQSRTGRSCRRSGTLPLTSSTAVYASTLPACNLSPPHHCWFSLPVLVRLSLTLRRKQSSTAQSLPKSQRFFPDRPFPAAACR